MHKQKYRIISWIKGDGIFLLFLLPSLLGVIVFFLAPFAVSLRNAMIDNPLTMNFVGLQHFEYVLSSPAFRLALKNTLIFLLVGIPLNMVFPLFLAMLLNKSSRSNIFALIFMLPLVIPSGSIVFFWKNVFGVNGIINALFFPINPVNWIDTPISRVIVMVIFLWKSAGFNMVLFMAGLKLIPTSYYETADIEGAGMWRKLTRITFVYLTPTIFVTFLMSFINSFKAFKEIYMLYGSYPNSFIYMLQHYMYNQFSAVNYQRLSASAYVLTLGFTVVLFFFFRIQNRLGDLF